MTPEEIRILRAMTPAQKLDALANLWHAARALKAAWLRHQHPAWSEDEVQRKVRDIFMKAAGCAGQGSRCCSSGASTRSALAAE